MTSNGKAVYYYNSDDEVYYQRGKGKSKLIGESDGGSFDIYKGKTLYWVEDGELKRSKSGGKAKTVGDFDGDVDYIFIEYKFIEAHTSDDDDSFLYLSKNGKKFELVSESNY
jgi:hypothetical protein